MKKITILTAIAGLTLGASLAYGYTADGGGVVGSKHDMNMLSGAAPDAQGRVCAFCHTPHHKVEATELDYNPLWSHKVNVDTSFAPYESVTFNSTIAGDPLAGPSRLCMSCHDGVIAVDQHYGNTGTALGGKITADGFGDIAIGKFADLSNDHPIGFDLNGIHTKDAGIRDTLKAPNNTTLNTQPITTLGFNNGKGQLLMTCASCHDVHNKDNKDTAFLYEKQLNSQFCVMCHDK
ncbi:cytochrome C [Geomonas terrae]|uniref:Cytochrome C n=1 Tax=Geomonas terrae TaxID=2562681 RepID=A0A4S1CBH4_9BACT|nr:cytochrome c3 family protein [Geomonas terrae]TGU70286.1 cytochrome C [Geomonas terrae]